MIKRKNINFRKIELHAKECSNQILFSTRISPWIWPTGLYTLTALIAITDTHRYRTTNEKLQHNLNQQIRQH